MTMYKFIAIIGIVLIFLSCNTTQVINEPFGSDKKLTLLSIPPVSDDFISAISQNLSQDEHKIKSLIIIFENQIYLEQYFNGWTRQNPHDLRSATKSISSLLVGIALDQGYFNSLEDPIISYLKNDYPNLEISDSIQIQHLLTMSSGLDCNDRDWNSPGHEDKMYLTWDWIHHFLGLDQVSQPGSLSHYCTGGVVVLGRLIEIASGLDLDEFSHRYLFGPLGINNYRWAQFADNSRFDSGGHLLLTPMALAKIGVLILQKGSWRGEQIVSSKWIEESISNQIVLDEQDYGYLWWINEILYETGALTIISARGNGGQILALVPEINLILVTTAGYFNSDSVRSVYALIYQSLVPYFQMVVNGRLLSGNQPSNHTK